MSLDISQNPQTLLADDMPHSHHTLDTQGLICPDPIMLLHKTIRKAAAGEVIHVLASDPATTRDIPNFCQHLRHSLLAKHTDINPQNQTEPDPYANVYHYWIAKNGLQKTPV